MKSEVAFFREKRKNPLADMVQFMRDMGMTKEQIAEELRLYHEKQVRKQEPEKVQE